MHPSVQSACLTSRQSLAHNGHLAVEGTTSSKQDAEILPHDILARAYDGVLQDDQVTAGELGPA